MGADGLRMVTQLGGTLELEHPVLNPMGMSPNPLTVYVMVNRFPLVAPVDPMTAP